MICPTCKLDLSTLPCRDCMKVEKALAILLDENAYVAEVVFADGRHSTELKDRHRAQQLIRDGRFGKGL